MKTFEEFREAMETDEELKTKAVALLADVTDEQAKIDLLVKFAVENGYDVSVEDFPVYWQKGVNSAKKS